MIKLNKRESAERQLNFAIKSFFQDDDLIVVHTLAGAAGIIFHDLVERKNPNDSWEKKIAQDNGLPVNECIKMFRKVQNFPNNCGSPVPLEYQ